MTEPAPRARSLDFDIICVGAGLANGLLAAALLYRHSGLRLAIVDARATPAYEQTWCFHATDVPAEDIWDWMAPFVAKRWEGHELVFPEQRHSFSGAYLSITGDSFKNALDGLTPRPHLMFGHAAAEVQPGRVTLMDGSVLVAPLILDGRGGRVLESGAGYQKFVGLEVELAEGSACMPALPVLMDATVPQVDGYRFLYLLPFSSDRMLIEDTYFSSSRQLDEQLVVGRIEEELARRRWQVARVVRQERGVLPMPWQADPTASPFPTSGVIKTGYGGGWFQPATGYSVPSAMAVAHAVAAAPAFDFATVKAALEPLWQRHQRQARFYRLLNRLAFRGVRDGDRLSVFQRFYRLPEALVARFYAGRSTWWDRVRILGGRPPVPLSRFQMSRLMEEVS